MHLRPTSDLVIEIEIFPALCPTEEFLSSKRCKLLGLTTKHSAPTDASSQINVNTTESTEE
jgi:hypothetical protein